MDFFELMYCGAALGKGCYLGAMGIHALTELIVLGIKQINKKQKQDRK